MIPPSHLVGTAAITENLLKRRWSAAILRHLNSGTSSPVEICAREPGLSSAAMNERLRTMLRYRLIVRCPKPGTHKEIDYRLTPKGRKILEMLDLIDEIDRQAASPPEPVDEDPASKSTACPPRPAVQANSGRNGSSHPASRPSTKPARFNS